ncbi:uracil-DNA glycosylase [Eudoraea sp.]|uniref:uracil-DNA glycosylase n=1 Tax=Eudoraea sp. TaxID=1979955 RepID=UPI003C70E880
MKVNIDQTWAKQLQTEFDEPYFNSLSHFVKQEYDLHTCYPKGGRIFASFNNCPFEEVKVVIIGQDPYHGAGQANGLCFSVENGTPHPPSLKNIFKELENDTKKPYPSSGDLALWAQQGVLLLNATLTVREKEPGSHQNRGWEKFTDAVIKRVSEELEGVVFLLWGGYAKKKSKLIDSSKHYILTSGHPSPLSANRGFWFGNNHFSKTNNILLKSNKRPIDW